MNDVGLKRLWRKKKHRVVNNLRVEAKDLKRSYYRIIGEIKENVVNNPYNRTKIPHLLLFYYAVECGLKLAWLRKEKLNFSPNKEEYEDFYTHNFSFFLSQLKIMASDSFDISQVTIIQNNSKERIHISKIHEAWRYGVAVMPDDEEKTMLGLKKISKWIEQSGYLK